MANPKRKMAVLKRVDDVVPIPGADRIELYCIGGWRAVDQKGKFEKGDVVIYIEPDAFCPIDNPLFASLAERGTKRMTYPDGTIREGHVLRTIRLRGQYSQGLLLEPTTALGLDIDGVLDLMAAGNALDDALGICEYVRERSAGTDGAAAIGRYDSSLAPRTDAERVQNIDDETVALLARSEHFVSVKVDGMSTTMTWDARTDCMRTFSHNREYDIENPSGTGAIMLQCMAEQGLDAWCKAHPGVVLQAELAGPGINGNRLDLKAHRLFVFSVYGTHDLCYINPYDDLRDTAMPLPAESLTPRLDIDLDGLTVTDLLDIADGLRGNVSKNRLDEGFVIHVTGIGNLNATEFMTLSRKLGSTMQVKAVSNRYLSRN